MLKKRSFKKIIASISLLILFLLLGQQFVEKQPNVLNQNQLSDVEDAHFWIISDNHFYSDDLFEDSERFRQFEATAVGKDIRYTSQVLTAFVKKALKEKPTGIILTGDTTLNGEKRSLTHMAEILEPLKAAGIPVLAIPGNHDIYNGWARKFVNQQQITAHQISPSDFREAFSDGYERSSQQDRFSLSYAIDLANYRLVLLDSNIYSDRFSKKEPITKGELKTKTLEWLENTLKEAQNLDKTPIIFMHHNLLAHNKKVTEGFVLNNAESVLKLVDEYQVPLAVTGHIHLQNIMQSMDHLNFYEITSSAFSTAGNQIGHLKLTDKQINYEVETFDPREYFDSQDLKNPDLQDYPSYLEEMYRQVGKDIAKNILVQAGVEDVDSLAEMVGEANLRYFTGNNQLSEVEKQKIRKDPRYAILKESVPQLWQSIEDSMEDTNIPDNRSITIDLP